jgi:hypothetical protein
MKAVHFSLILMTIACLLTPLAHADLIITGTTGAFQANSGPTETGSSGYWDNGSSDGSQCNVGYILNGGGLGCNSATGTPISPLPPTNMPFWGIGTAADPDFHMTKTATSSTTALKVEIAGQSGSNTFGYYTLDSSNNITRHELFAGSDVPGATNFIGAGVAVFGFYIKSIGSGANPNTEFYTQSSLNPNDTGLQHFALFREAPPGTSGNNATVYWIGAEDLLFSSSDKDYNDMIVKITSVPDGGLTLMLLGGALVGIESLRRRFRA